MLLELNVVVKRRVSVECQLYTQSGHSAERLTNYSHQTGMLQLSAIHSHSHTLSSDRIKKLEWSIDTDHNFS